MNENVRQKEGKAFRPWCEDGFITKVELPGISQDRVGDPNAGSGISGRRESAQAQYFNGLHGIRPKKGAWLVEVRPDEELPADFCVSLRRILVPTALDEASAVALDYASALARRFGSELALLYAFEGSDYAQSSDVEAKLLRVSQRFGFGISRPGFSWNPVQPVSRSKPWPTLWTPT